MDNNLQTALAELITKANQGVDTATGFLVSEVPEVIHQLLLWKAVMSAISFTITMIGIGVIAYYWKHVFRYFADEEMAPAILMTVCMVVAVSLIASITLSFDWLQIWLAPKVWLLEYASQLVK